MGKGESSSKRTITKDDWEKRLQSVKVAREDLNRLVMNFFVTEGFLEAAEAFARESGTEPGVDLTSLTDRMEIRRAVHGGDIEHAIERVNDLDPELLEEDSRLFFRLQQQRFIELIRDGKTEQALEFAQESLAPRGEENPSFLEELERTVALLAFEDKRASPVGELLDLSQRQRTAMELNAAVLGSQSLERESRIVTLLKLLLWSQGQLEEKANFPVVKDLLKPSA